MQIRHLLLFGISLMGITTVTAQEKMSLTLQEAVQLAWTKSNEVNLANAKVNTSKYELQTAKNNQYPDFKLSGQYQRLTHASVEMANMGSSTTAMPEPDQVMLAQANIGLPIFAGFKIQLMAGCDGVDASQAVLGQAFEGRSRGALAACRAAPASEPCQIGAAQASRHAQ